jgi:hypothetical protein
MKQKTSILLFIFIVFFQYSCIVRAQSIQRQTISSTGSYFTSDGYLIRQTIGQPYNTKTSNQNNISYRPGFQQPVFQIEILLSNLKLTIFPNPSSDFVNIESSVVLKGVKLDVFDNIGQLVFTSNFESFKSFKLNCTNYSSGAYIINITSITDKKALSAKLIINR